MSVPRIRKNDVVIAIAGASAGKTGKVLQVMRTRGRAIVEGVNPVRKTLRKSQDHPQGGFVQKDAALDLSNLMPYCPSCKKGVKIGKEKDGKRSVRRCRACRHSFDG